MSILYIYGDESGPMPLNDSDDLFVAATVAFLGKTPVAIRGSDKDEMLVSIFRSFNAIPFTSVVKPFPGYSKAIKRKYEKIQVMARATRLMMDTKSQSLGQTSMNLRNIIWLHAMTQAIVNAAGSIMFDNDIDSVRIILDDKTLSQPMRLLFTESLRRMGTNMKKLLQNHIQFNPVKMSQYISHIKFTAKDTFISWSNVRSEFGLKLVHQLAIKTYRQLKGGGKEGIESKLRDAGFENFVIDITDIVTNLDQRLIDNFKQNTGLPEPREL